MKNWIFIFMVISNFAYAQQSENLIFLVDSMPSENPTLLNLPVDSGFMAVERIEISNDGNELYYGVRNGYDSTSIAEIRRMNFSNQKWSQPMTIFPDSCGAPALSDDNKTMFFQYDHPKTPRGFYSERTKSGWTKPKPFIDSLKKSHYLQSPINNSFYYSASLDGKEKRQDIFKVIINKSDTTITNLGFNLNGDFADFFVSRDESYIILIISKSKNAKNFEFFGELDLFISFQADKNSWTKPVNLGKKINGLSNWTWAPYVTNDNKYLIFSSWPKAVGTYMIDFGNIFSRLKKENLNKN